MSSPEYHCIRGVRLLPLRLEDDSSSCRFPISFEREAPQARQGLKRLGNNRASAHQLQISDFHCPEFVRVGNDDLRGRGIDPAADVRNDSFYLLRRAAKQQLLGPA